MQDTKQQWFKDAKFGLFIHWGYIQFLQESIKEREQIGLRNGL